ncbi:MULTISPECIES: TraX family protein [unclassified Sedimentibacter]|uniref:TraX family protein n=1 Tax=unclassified Sedimentibacter TaxID=2649220 RepID=UPI0027DF8071|nr:TraX family protein [Sedimentibacter sp. MB35-C1]WMJ78847.1 TraX family protein [Sedimentibacter sp. MB35-C1]
MNVFALKIIALVTMIIDHYGAIFQEDMMIFRMIGRIAFPIYCFLLVEGYFHTSNFKKYAQRLLLFALISEIPFDLAFFNQVGFVHQNIFFTLFIGLITIYILDNKVERFKFNNTAVIISACILAVLLKVDYDAMGIVYILTFYFTRNQEKPKKFIITSIVMIIVNFSSVFIQQLSLLALPFIYKYNGSLGAKNKFLQISFYAVYPLHLLIYYAAKLYL